MFDSCFKFICLGKNTSLVSEALSCEWIYRFDDAYGNRYLVHLQCFHIDIVAVKFCDRKDKNKVSAYSIVYNDRQPFKIFSTVVNILVAFLKKHHQYSFGYFAAPRQLEYHAMQKDSKTVLRSKSNDFAGVRGRYYEYMMINKFNPLNFKAFFDSTNNLCVMINRKIHTSDQAVVSFAEIVVDYLARHFGLLLNPDDFNI